MLIFLRKRKEISKSRSYLNKDEEERLDFVEWLRDLEYEVYRMPIPNITILLNIPVDIAYKNSKKVNKLNEETKNNGDLHDSNFEYLNNTYNAYHYLANKYNWTVISSTSSNHKLYSPEYISEKVYNVVKNII